MEAEDAESFPVSEAWAGVAPLDNSFFIFIRIRDHPCESETRHVQAGVSFIGHAGSAAALSFPASITGKNKDAWSIMQSQLHICPLPD